MLAKIAPDPALCYAGGMERLPSCPCINCGAESLQIERAEKRFEDGSDPPLWIATVFYVVCGVCGHKFQIGAVPE